MLAMTLYTSVTVSYTPLDVYKRQSEQVAFPSHRDGYPGSLGIIVDKRSSIAERNIPIAVTHTAISISTSGVNKIFAETGVGPYGESTTIVEMCIRDRYYFGVEADDTGSISIAGEELCEKDGTCLLYTSRCV